MCGIAGRFNLDDRPVNSSDLLNMNARLKHRGPDGSGYYLDGAIGLAQTRLAVIDVPGGAQPMFNEDRNIVLVFNGEIYNFQSLRRDLEKRHRFSTVSDTEVIIHLYEEEGIDCVKRFRGMFAFALWDSVKKKLFLVRDRVGQKPLYYHCNEKGIVFGSEIGALLAGGVTSTLNYTALDLFFRNQFISGPETIYQSIHSLPPAHVLTFDQSGLESNAYWSPSMSTDDKMSEGDFSDALRSTLSEAVQLRLISDVPLGAFLSGGVDSSIIVSLMREAGVKQIKSFSIGFKEKTYDETSYAMEAAAYFKTEHQSLQCQENIEERLPEIINRFDQPFGDSSAVAVYQLSEMTRSSVTVALSGDGSDELFAGYRRYVGRKLLKYYWMIPKVIRTQFIERLMASFPEGMTYYRDSLIKQFIFFTQISNRLEADPLDLIASTFTRSELEELYLPHIFTELKQSKKNMVEKYLDRASSLDAVSQMMWVDFHSYLPDDILVKTDRMSMAHGLEVRSPFLDQEVVALAMKMPMNLKLRSFHTKYLLKKTFSDLLPSSILNRKKHGFMLPLGDWFKQTLNPMITSVLQKQDSMGLFNMDYIAQLLREHQKGKHDNSQKLWLLLVFFLWEERAIAHVQ